MNRSSLVAWTALAMALIALCLSGWAVSEIRKSRAEIQGLGRVLRATAGRMSLGEPPRPEFDPVDR